MWLKPEAAAWREPTLGGAIVAGAALVSMRLYVTGAGFARGHELMARAETSIGGMVAGAALSQYGLVTGWAVLSLVLLSLIRFWSASSSVGFRDVLAWVGVCHAPLLLYMVIANSAMATLFATFDGMAVVNGWTSRVLGEKTVPYLQILWIGRVTSLLAGAALLAPVVAAGTGLPQRTAAVMVGGAVLATVVIGRLASF